MSDLVSRLSETLDELERVATEAQPGPWVAIPSEMPGEWSVHHWITFRGEPDRTRMATTHGLHCAEADAGHIARWDPKAVLGLVAAVREVIAEYYRVRKLWSDALDKGDDSLDEAVAHRYWSVRTLAVGFGITEEG